MIETSVELVVGKFIFMYSMETNRSKKGVIIFNSFNQTLTNALMTLFNEVIIERQRYHSNAEERVFNENEFENLKRKYAAQNAAITAAANLVPGPWGLAALLPEIILVSRNQLAMIFDIAEMHGRHRQVDTELLAYVFGSGFGTSLGGLGIIQGGKLIVKRPSLRVLQKAVSTVAGQVTQKAIKTAVGKFLPVIGATPFRAW